MKTLISLIAIIISSTAFAAPEDAFLINLGGLPNCEWAVATNFFELEPGDLVSFEIDMTGCMAGEEQGGGYLLRGMNVAGKNQSLLSVQNGIDLRLLDASGVEVDYETCGGFDQDGNLEVSFCLVHSSMLGIQAENVGRKTRTIRLNGQVQP